MGKRSRIKPAPVRGTSYKTHRDQEGSITYPRDLLGGNQFSEIKLFK